MNYELSIGPWSSIFAVPCSLIDTYIKMADGNKLKVILWMLRHSDTPQTSEAIADGTGLTTEVVDESMEYWKQNNILLKRDTFTAASEETTYNISAIKPTDIPIPESSDLYKSDDDISTELMEKNADFRSLRDEIERIINKPISKRMLNTIAIAYSDYSLPKEVIMMIAGFAKSVSKDTPSYIKKVAENWSSEGINTLEQAEQKVKILTDTQKIAWPRLAAIIGISNHDRKPSDNELMYSYKWFFEYKFSDEMVEIAYDNMINHISKIQLSYMDKILTSWYNKGIKTPEDVANNNINSRNSTDDKYSYDIDELETSNQL
jgi:DnaD/phage-associated family protein